MVDHEQPARLEAVGLQAFDHAVAADDAVVVVHRSLNAVEDGGDHRQPELGVVLVPHLLDDEPAVGLLPLALWAVTLVDGPIAWFYLAFFLAPIAGTGITFVTWTQLVSQWFDQRRGLEPG